jgi:hypothetical protein
VNLNESGDVPFRAFYESPVHPAFMTPFVDRAAGNIQDQRFPLPIRRQMPTLANGHLRWFWTSGYFLKATSNAAEPRKRDAAYF